MSVPFGAFGPGILIISRTDTSAPLAINVGYAQELTIDASGTTKSLFGQNQFPLLAARGTIKATGKWKAAVVSGIAWNAAFYGNTGGSTAGLSTGVGFTWSVDSTFTASTLSSQVSVATTATFETDLGVKYASGANAGFPLQRVGVGNEGASGRYSMSTSTGAGIYNFGSVDAGTGGSVPSGGTPLKITYTTNTVSAGYQSLIYQNQLIGSTPTFQLDYYTNLNQPGSTPFAIRLFQCVGSKHAMAFKLEDFMMPEFDFDFFANNAGQVFEMVFPQIS